MFGMFSFLSFLVKAEIGTVGTTFIINSPDEGRGSGEVHDGATSNHMFHVGDYWYKMASEYYTSVSRHRWFWVSTIDTNLTDWSDASSKNIFVLLSYTGSMWAQYQAVYDEEQGLFHCVWTDQGGDAVVYVQGTPNATGGVTFGSAQNIKTVTNNANLDICLMNGKPVITLSGHVGDVGWSTWALFSSDEDGTSWTNTYADTYGELTFTYCLLQTHAISSTHVYVILQEGVGVDNPLYGFYASTTLNATTSITQITTENVEGDSFKSSGDKMTAGYSTVSVNTITPTDYASLITILYVNTTKSLKTLFWDVSDESISGDVEVIYTSESAYHPLHPLSAMENNVIWAGFWNRTDGDDSNFILYERDIIGTWGSSTTIDSGKWGTATMIPSTMNKQPYDGKLIVTHQLTGTDVVYGCDVEAFLPPFDYNFWFVIVGLITFCAITLYAATIMKGRR